MRGRTTTPISCGLSAVANVPGTETRWSHSVSVPGTETSPAGGAVTLNVTGIVCGLSEAPAAVMVILPGTCPALSAAALAVTTTVEGAVPLVALTLNHGSDSASVHDSVPVPVLVIVRFCVGATSPATAANVIDRGLIL